MYSPPGISPKLGRWKAYRIDEGIKTELAFGEEQCTKTKPFFDPFWSKRLDNYYKVVRDHILCIDDKNDTIGQMYGDPEYSYIRINLEYCWEYDDPENCLPKK